MESSQLEGIVERIGEAVLTTTEAIDQLCERMDTLAQQIQQQNHQIQQQSYQIVALSDAVQTLAENQDDTLSRLTQLTEVLQRLTVLVEKSG